MKSGRKPLKVSLIATVCNEEHTIESLLSSLATQTRQPDEIIFVDGGSGDDTVEVLRQWQNELPVSILEQPGASISEGRNIAMKRATGDVIAVTDAGARLNDYWLEELTRPFSQDGCPVDVVSGFFLPDAQNSFERALAASTLPDQSEIVPDTFLPSSRSLALRREWISAGIQYPEWLDYCEDLVFDLRLRRAGARFLFCPSAVVYFRPRTSTRSFIRQYYLYARGDGKSGLFTKRHVIRYMTYLVALPLVLRTRSWRSGCLCLIGGLLYMRLPIQRIQRRHGDQSAVKRAELVVRATLLRFAGDLAKMAGYPVGLWWRYRRGWIRKNWKTIPD